MLKNEYDESGTKSSKNTYLGHAMNVVNSRYRYCKKEQDVSPWVVIQDTPEAVEQAIRKGAMFVSTPALSEPYDAQNPDAEIMRFDNLVLDFDDKANPGNALRGLRILIGHIQEIYGVDPYCMRLWCSGGKGFHAEIPSECFNSQDGDPYLPLIYKRIVCQWAASLELSTIDISMYCMGSGKMFRIAGVMRDNGRRKVPLTLDEVQSLPIETLWKLSENPREVEPVEFDTACEDLAKLYQECKEQVHAEIEEFKKQPPVDPEIIGRLQGKTSPCIIYILTNYPTTKKTSFNGLVMNLVKYFQSTGSDINNSLHIAESFLQSYPHSTSYTTYNERLKHFREQWAYHQGRSDSHFNCSYIKGYGFPGSAFDCKKCQANEPSEPASGAEKKRYAYITGKELMVREFKEPPWFLLGFLPKGLLIFGGKPKAGKSLMVGNLVIAVVTGGMFFNLKLEQQTVLLLGLEDTYRRLQDRFRKMTIDSGADLSRLIIFNEFAKADQGGMKDLEEMILLHKPGLVVIDTLKKFKSASNAKKQLYDENYDSVDEIKKMADRHSITIILVHHLRKMESEDPFDTFSGSLGLTAAADSLWVMQNGKGGMALNMTGRDMEPSAKAIKLHPESLTWHILGDADEVQKSSQQQAIFDCLKNSATPLKPRDVHGLVDGISYEVVRKLLKKMFSANKVILDEKGLYTVPRSSSLYNNKNFEYTPSKEKEENRSYRSGRSGCSECSGHSGTVDTATVPHDSPCKDSNLDEKRNDRNDRNDNTYSEHRNAKNGFYEVEI